MRQWLSLAPPGSTGSIAGHNAKIKGFRVIGTAGGKRKCDWLVETAKFDAAIDYKVEDVGARLSELCPRGIDMLRQRRRDSAERGAGAIEP